MSRNSTNNIVYLHVRHDRNEVFYVGIGERGRENVIGRNPIWHHICQKTTYEAKIIYENLSWSEACHIEKELISIWGRKCDKTGQLSNMSKGGDGGDTLTDHPDIESIGLKISNRLKGVPKSDEAKRKMSEAKLGVNLSDAHRENISKSLIGNDYRKGRKHSDESKRKISEGGKGIKKPRTQNHQDNLSASLKGKNSKPVMIDNVRYQTLRLAADAKGCSPSTIRVRLNSVDFPSYYRI